MTLLIKFMWSRIEDKSAVILKYVLPEFAQAHFVVRTVVKIKRKQRYTVKSKFIYYDSDQNACDDNDNNVTKESFPFS